MSKIRKDPNTVLYPCPVALVSCADRDGHANIVTIAWAGIVCSEPPMVSVSVRPSRYSYPIIRDTGQFVINLPGEELLHATDLCGTLSGRKGDKFEAAGFTPEPASIVKAPMIRECPVSLECEVRHTLHLGTHEMFIAEVLAVHADESVLDERGRLDANKARPLAYMPWSAEYWTLQQSVGKYGFSAKTK